MLRRAVSRHGGPRAIAPEQAALWAVAATRTVAVRDRQGAALEQFGLDREEELQRFAPYCARFGFGDRVPLAVG